MTIDYLLTGKAISKAVQHASLNATSIRVLAAWATKGAGLSCFKYSDASVKRAVIGTSFAFTEPSALRSLQEMGFELRVLAVGPDGGTYHPKVYIFEDTDNHCTVLLGSANLTHAAFTRNSEIMARIDMTRGEAANLFEHFEHCWNLPNAKEVTEEFLNTYTAAYVAGKQRQQRELLQSEHDPHSQATHDTQSVSAENLMNCDFQEFVRVITSRHDLDNRFIDGPDNSYLNTIAVVGAILQNGFTKASSEDIYNKLLGKKFEFGWLGTMRLAHMPFKEIRTDGLLQARIDKILEPIWGPSEERKCLDIAQSIYAQLIVIGGINYGFITRMLALARPDKFYSVNGASIQQLSSLLRIDEKDLVTWEGYLDGLELFYKTPWYRSPMPKQSAMKKLWQARVALIDAYAYDVNPNHRDKLDAYLRE